MGRLRLPRRSRRADRQDHRRSERERDQENLGSGIAAIAAELPVRVVENDELATPLGLDSEWISSRTGVLRRHRADGETLVDLAAGAGSRALALADVDPSEIDLVLVATLTRISFSLTPPRS